MQCKCGCNKEVISKGTKPKLFYSDACRKKWNRTQVGHREPEQTDIIANGQKETDTNGQAIKGPAIDKITWTKDTLVEAKPTHDQIMAAAARGLECTPSQILTPSMLDTLPVGVARPTGQPNARTQAMTGENLNRRLIGVKVWQQTPEYAEVVHRLLSGKTEGMNLPTWAVVCRDVKEVQACYV